MNALPCYAEHAAREYQRVQDMAANRAAAELDALEEMRGNKSVVDEFLRDPNENPDVAGLMALFLGHGLPSRDATSYSDGLILRFEHRHEALTSQFDAWARKRSPMLHSSPLQRWMEVQS